MSRRTVHLQTTCCCFVLRRDIYITDKACVKTHLQSTCCCFVLRRDIYITDQACVKTHRAAPVYLLLLIQRNFKTASLPTNRIFVDCVHRENFRNTSPRFIQTGAGREGTSSCLAPTPYLISVHGGRLSQSWGLVWLNEDSTKLRPINNTVWSIDPQTLACLSLVTGLSSVLLCYVSNNNVDDDVNSDDSTIRGRIKEILEEGGERYIGAFMTKRTGTKCVITCSPV